ncbi:ArsR/SmtB family transcription factor [Kocuria sp. NPDC057446]|uniref:ArsR/SmtB family transcription factor n=1 Tax=Kocuria sp. NPDC057446 TaxID=3346137 RepID=UPI0036BC42E8
MVVEKELTDEQVDRVFRALADTTRRDIVTRVLRQEQSVSALAGHYRMSFAAVQKHVAVLERAALITKERRGREQVVHGNVAALRRAAGLLEDYEKIWRGRARAIEDLLAEEAPPGDRGTQ